MVLRLRDFRLAFGAFAVSMVGDRMVTIALAFAVLELGGSASDVGIVLASRTVPIVATLLIGGVVVTESVYAIPGLGRLTVDAVLARDFPTIQGVILLFSFVYVLVNLAVDLSYVVLDPRIRY